MVDEDLKLYTIDFPQMVSTNHKEADFYFERDQNCIQVLFKRKFNYVCDRKYQLSEIECMRRMDEEIKASGYNKEKKGREDEVLEGYLKENRDFNDADVVEADESADEEEANLGEGHAAGEMDEKEFQDGEQIEKDVQEELKKLDIGQLEEAHNPADADTLPKQEEGPEEAEEYDLEKEMERRRQMKELKKQAKSARRPVIPAKAEPPNAEKTEEGTKPQTQPKKEDSEEEEGDSDSSDEKENEFIKKALKKKFKKKKVQKAKKNKPKELNEIMKEHMM
jgi:RIO kinase 2